MTIILPKEPVVVAGIKGPVAQRLEIRDLMQNKPMWYLFLKGLQAFQRQDAKNPRSYYAISGIHGLPFVPYNEVVGRKLDNSEIGHVGGYCAHTSIVFATWHRPFLALFEQELSRSVKQEAAKMDDPSGVFKTAAEAFRLPYWDWALPKSKQPEFWPNALDTPTITVDGFPPIDPNPLATFSRKGLSINAREKWAFSGEQTRRLPDLGDKFSEAVDARNTSVSRLLFTDSSWITFSNNGYIRSQTTDKFFSIEEVHDKIHIEVGRTMGSITTSAFDPVFWLHHCNIDRLTAIRQAIWPRNYIDGTGEEVGRNGTNFVARTGDIQNDKTPLKPFWRTTPTAADALSTAKYDAVFWNSQQVENTEVFGYTYPETFDRSAVSDVDKWASVVAARAGKLYPAALKPKSRQANSTSPHPITSAAPTNRDPSDLIEPDNTFTDWSVNVRAIKHILSKPYQIIVFDGDFSPEPAHWTSEHNKVDTVGVLGTGSDTACAKCREDQANDQSITGVVSLTSALVQDYTEGRLASLKPEDVVPYLTANLHWRVLVDGVTDVPREEVPGLVVCVSSATVGFDENGLPRYSTDHTLHPEITDGRPAGLSAGEEP
ncbi:Di-copper centre-containing protein [Echria macrotheca]|uniref:tyrosinase n=1 Tax=Echria macrotheca TaxID=438768 RepID=A0AAJ0BIF4_9PEZI|nr:Di-copper centre-containing protein [Echria macrotheca]